MGPKKRACSAASRLTASSLVLFVVAAVMAGVMVVSVARTWAQQPLPPCMTPAVLKEIEDLKALAKKESEDWTHMDRVIEIEDRIRALLKLPDCPEIPQTPPPPPPKPNPSPTPTPTPQPQLPPAGAEAHHRWTNCRPACNQAEKDLNDAIDDYNKYSGGTFKASYYQSMMNRSHELDECEKQCLVPPSVPVFRGPGSGPQRQPERSPDGGQPLFDWGPYSVPNGPGSVLQPRRPTDNRTTPR